MSPVRSSTTSPGTRSAARTSAGAPARRTCSCAQFLDARKPCHQTRDVGLAYRTQGLKLLRELLTNAREGGVTQGGERALRPITREHIGSDDRHETCQDQDAVAHFTEQDGQASGDEQEDDERFHDGAADGPQDRRPRNLLELVRTRARPSRGHVRQL